MPAQQQVVPFRAATLERVEMLSLLSQQMAAGASALQRDIEGNGFIYGLNINVNALTAANAAATAYAEDGPWSAIDQISFRDVGGELISLRSGWEAYLAQLIDKQYAMQDSSASANTGLYQALTGSGATGGSFNFWLKLRLGLNRRDVIGLLGNQDRAQKYSLRSDVAASTSVYTTAPTTLPVVNIQRYYESYSVPNQQAPNGAPQQVLPDSYGTIHSLTSVNSEVSPQPGQQTHYLRRLNNTIRWIAFVFRAGAGATPRATADAAMSAWPGASVMLKFGSDVQFQESYLYRRALMYDRWGFELPAGVLVYDAIHDFSTGAGSEVGDDYWHTQGLNNASLVVTYPAAYGTNAANLLTIITDDMIYQTPVTLQQA